MILFDRLYMHFKTREDKKELSKTLKSINVSLMEIRDQQETLIEDAHKLEKQLERQVIRYKEENNLTARRVIETMILGYRAKQKTLEDMIPRLHFKSQSYETQRSKVEMILFELRNPSNITRIDYLREQVTDTLSNWDEERKSLMDLDDISQLEGTIIPTPATLQQTVSAGNLNIEQPVNDVAPVSPELQEILDTYSKN